MIIYKLDSSTLNFIQEVQIGISNITPYIYNGMAKYTVILLA